MSATLSRIPASWNSRYRSFPSRVRALTPRAPVPRPVDAPPLPRAPRLLDLQVQAVPLARALAHAAEHRPPAVPGGDVVDELLDDHRLADAGPAEEADLPALHERGDQVDDLDPRLEDLGLRLE